MARNKRRKPSGPSADGWIVTFSDTMTLLLTFFILLYSFSTVDTEKFKLIASSLQSVLNGSEGILSGEGNINDLGNLPILTTLNPNKASQDNESPSPTVNTSPTPTNYNAYIENIELYEIVKKYFDVNNLNTNVEIIQNTRGVVIQIKDNVLFNSGSADILDNSTIFLNSVDDLIHTLNNEVIVEGHTDNVPISTSIFKSNWELSAARAISVVNYFINKGENPSRFSAQGYGEYRPITLNDTAENRSKNRRVNILIVYNENKIS